MMFRSTLAATALVLSTLQALASDPLATVRSLSDALQAGQSAEALALIDTDQGGYAYSLDGPLTTGENFRAWLQSDIVGPGSKFEVESQTVSGNTVDALVVWGRGAPTTPARYVFEVRDGKIVSWRMTNR
jgi:limonene-1,2-epoxide hydrolase